jgi:hypothetical protein
VPREHAQGGGVGGGHPAALPDTAATETTVGVRARHGGAGPGGLRQRAERPRASPRRARRARPAWTAAAPARACTAWSARCCRPRARTASRQGRSTCPPGTTAPRPAPRPGSRQGRRRRGRPQAAGRDRAVPQGDLVRTHRRQRHGPPRLLTATPPSVPPRAPSAWAARRHASCRARSVNDDRGRTWSLTSDHVVLEHTGSAHRHNRLSHSNVTGRPDEGRSRTRTGRRPCGCAATPQASHQAVDAVDSTACSQLAVGVRHGQQPEASEPEHGRTRTTVTVHRGPLSSRPRHRDLGASA